MACYRDMLPVSMLIKAPDNAHDLTVICAVAVCHAIERLSGIKAGIKWTNDIICSERKVCGILCESTLKSSCDGAIYNNVICGMGLNVNQDADFFVSIFVYLLINIFFRSSNCADN